jgi:DNA polymerase-3 subunit delta
VIIKNIELDKKRLITDINFFLLYGTNSELIKEKIKKNFIPLFSNNTYKYTESEVISNSKQFQEELSNKSFFENEKLIIINHVSEKILEIIKRIIEAKIPQIKIILISNLLEKKSKLRNYFEKNTDTIISAFYDDDYKVLNFYAQEILKKEGIFLSSQDLNFLINKSKNRVNLKSELEKVILYYKGKSKISSINISKLISNSEDIQISELIDECLLKNKKKLLNIINENNNFQDNQILIIKSFLIKLKRLKKLKQNINYNENIETIISSYKPPIFWKEKPVIKEQLKIYSLKRIKDMLVKLNNLELIIKKNSQVSNHVINDFIFSFTHERTINN